MAERAPEEGRFYRKEGIPRNDTLSRHEDQGPGEITSLLREITSRLNQIEGRSVRATDLDQPELNDRVFINQRFGGGRPFNHHWRPTGIARGGDHRRDDRWDRYQNNRYQNNRYQNNRYQNNRDYQGNQDQQGRYNGRQWVQTTNQDFPS